MSFFVRQKMQRQKILNFVVFEIHNMQRATFHQISTLYIVLGLLPRLWSAGSDCDKHFCYK